MYICPCHSLTLSQLTLPPPHVLKSMNMLVHKSFGTDSQEWVYQKGPVSLNPRQAEPFPTSIPSAPLRASGPFLSHILYCTSLLSQSSYQITLPPALDGNPGYFERSFASWENPYVSLIARKVTHPDLPIMASAPSLSPNNDNINYRKRINNSLVSTNFVLSVPYL